MNIRRPAREPTSRRHQRVCVRPAGAVAPWKTSPPAIETRLSPSVGPQRRKRQGSPLTSVRLTGRSTWCSSFTNNYYYVNRHSLSLLKFTQIHSKNSLSNFENQQNPGFWGAYPSFIWERSKTDPARKRVFRRWLLPLTMNKNLRFSNVSTCW